MLIFQGVEFDHAFLGRSIFDVAKFYQLQDVTQLLMETKATTLHWQPEGPYRDHTHPPATRPFKASWPLRAGAHFRDEDQFRDEDTFPLPSGVRRTFPH